MIAYIAMIILAVGVSLPMIAQWMLNQDIQPPSDRDDHLSWGKIPADHPEALTRKDPF